MKLMDEVMLQEKRMIADRRYLHENPELSNQEYHTTEFIRKRLQEFGVEIENLNLKTGVSALIRGKGNGKTICIRHDIDALPIQEQTGLDFSSKNEGVSHSCGHDIHIVTALYSAKILQQHKDELNGNVRIVFQPAEENVTGAKAVIAAGLMQKEPLNDIVVGLHTHPQTPVGKICLKKGPMEAGNDYLITSLQTIVSRENMAVHPTVVTIASIHAGKTYNSIPGEVVMLGSMRSLYQDSREHNLEALRRITKSVCESMRAEGTVEIADASLPPITNDSQVVNDLIQVADEMLGKGHVLEFEQPSMGSDDFSVFLNYSKGAQFFLGTANESVNSKLGLHNGKNIFDEKSLVTGVAVLTGYVMKSLRGGKL